MKKLVDFAYQWTGKGEHRRRVAIINDFLDALERCPLEACSADGSRGIGYYALRYALDVINDSPYLRTHPARSEFKRLIYDKPEYKASIDIRSITAISSWVGDPIADLDALPETMGFYGREPSYGPFSEAGMTELCNAVYQEFGNSVSEPRLFSVTDVTWSEERIAGNTGASRRFSLWRRLSSRERCSPTRIDALMYPVALNDAAFLTLIRDWRLVLVKHNPMLFEPFLNVKEVWPDGISIMEYERYSGGRQKEYWLIPKPHNAPPEVRARLVCLHAQLDMAGVLDVFRSVCEARSAYLQVQPHLADDIVW
ncbi:hypothetical protein [Acetobacter peroxydans]|uniref:Uncharacterized protein n=1 Tax=Acetobacter peroxydans TaxID=104098 RepID=A0A4Y3TYS5_9PROT|nr:hypothetical protein [Acetobacter peroxydans]NHO17359.1 hypothetical protein [Acetobacter peroxydans]GBR37789.1 hypothetical protein AA13755_1996 [Acetobacter peroxydans NBRC 13755]GBR40076.1 hypothetical protein AA0475_0469 [Acetobacter peroxydans]GEB86609.1 hypothetical protein APE01nite_24060 [Acetobacter peroxydans]